MSRTEARVRRSRSRAWHACSRPRRSRARGISPVQRPQRRRMVAAAHGLGGTGQEAGALRIRGLAPDGPDLGLDRCGLDGAGGGFQSGEQRVEARIVLAGAQRAGDEKEDEREEGSSHRSPWRTVEGAQHAQRRAGGAVAVVDVDRDHARGAARERACQRGPAARGDAVADRGRAPRSRRRRPGRRAR